MARTHAICIASVLLLALFLTCASAATFDIWNNCPFTVWAAAVPGGGRQLDRGQSWSLTVSPGTKQARIWPRTNCLFDAAGKGMCETGDCGGVRECTSFGQPPNTLAEYALNQFGGKDFFDISLVDGFNVPMDFSPTSNGCNPGIVCAADIIGQCPAQLKAPGGCNNPCTVFKTDQYCCNSGSCGPTNFSKFFKDRCPDAYSYPEDDPTSTFTCPAGTNYRVVFCPSTSSFTDAATFKDAATFRVVNQCTYTVWAAATPGGGRRLDPGQTWVLSEGAGTTTRRIWGRTNCSFDANGQGQCETGDCDLLLDCSSSSSPPSTVAEFNSSQNGRDILDISLVNGFNIPMQLRPTTGACRGIKCSDDINNQCPEVLKAPGGCNDPCTVFKTAQYCCNNASESCGSTAYSQFFKDRCPDAFSYPRDDPATFTCPGGTNYTVTFCP